MTKSVMIRVPVEFEKLIRDIQVEKTKYDNRIVKKSEVLKGMTLVIGDDELYKRVIRNDFEKKKR